MKTDEEGKPLFPPPQHMIESAIRQHSKLAIFHLNEVLALLSDEPSLETEIQFAIQPVSITLQYGLEETE